MFQGDQVGLRPARRRHVQGRTAGGQEVVYRGEIAPGGALYGNGPLHVEVENSTVYYHGPSGTHGTSDTACGPATAGSSVPADFRIFAAEGAQDTDGDGDADLLTGAAWVYRLDGTGAKVPCRGQGTFARGHQSSDPNWRADWTLNEDCVVVGNQAGTPGTGVAKARTAHTQHGTHAPCFLPPCVDNFRVDYKQYPPIEGFNAALSGPTAASMPVWSPLSEQFRNAETGLRGSAAKRLIDIVVEVPYLDRSWHRATFSTTARPDVWIHLSAPGEHRDDCEIAGFGLSNGDAKADACGERWCSCGAAGRCDREARLGSIDVQPCPQTRSGRAIDIGLRSGLVRRGGTATSGTRDSLGARRSAPARGRRKRSRSSILRYREKNIREFGGCFLWPDLSG